MQKFSQQELYWTIILEDLIIFVEKEKRRQIDSNGNHGNHTTGSYTEDWTPEIPFENVSNTFYS